MKTAISGASGLIGQALFKALKNKGHSLTRLVRKHEQAQQEGFCYWNPYKNEIDAKCLEGHDVVIHLAGAGIADKRWTDERKRLILESRTKGTTLIAKCIAGLSSPPKLFISASATGYYGTLPACRQADESCPHGNGFLADVCLQWEQAANPAKEAGIRTVHPRFGVVLSKDGGMLARLLPVFKKGLGGKVGDGRQILSWIGVDDLIGALLHIIEHPEIEGPVNLVAPNPVTNREFTAALAQAVKRPAFLPLPSFVARLAFGEMAEELLLAGAGIRCMVLHDSGYTFKHTHLKDALADLLLL